MQINETYVGNMTPYQEARSRFDSLAKLHAYTLREYGRQPRMDEASSYHNALSNPPEGLASYEKDILITDVETAMANLKAMREDLTLAGAELGYGLHGEVRQVNKWLALAEQYINKLLSV